MAGRFLMEYVAHKAKEMRRKFREREKAFFASPGKFLLFSISIIIISLTLYQAGYFDLVTSLLAVLWIIFWLNSSPMGKSFLLVASLLGFTHELIGVYFGWFSYNTALFWGVPFYILPGYGCIYWAAQNFWKNTKWLLPTRRLYPVMIAALVGFYLIDFFILNFGSAVFVNTIVLVLILLLVYQLSEQEQNLAFFVLLLTGFNEVLGTVMGAWAHYPFSLVSSVPPYVFVVWLCVALTHSLLGDRKISRRELLLGIAVFAAYSVNLIRAF